MFYYIFYTIYIKIHLFLYTFYLLYIKKKIVISENNYEFLTMRPHTFALPPTDAAIVAQGRAMVDWNVRNAYCPACGKKMSELIIYFKKKK